MYTYEYYVKQFNVYIDYIWQIRNSILINLYNAHYDNWTGKSVTNWMCLYLTKE